MMVMLMKAIVSGIFLLMRTPTFDGAMGVTMILLELIMNWITYVAFLAWV